MKKCVSKAKLTYEELETVLIEIEMVINSRPLTYLYEEVEEALTPSHLVLGRRLLSTTMKGEASVVEHSHELLTSRYRYLQEVIEHYTKRFMKEYLSELHQHHLYTRGKGNYEEFCKLLLGDVVLIKDDSLKRNQWKKGKVEELISGKDGQVRGAMLKVSHEGKVSFIQRPLQHIIPLEVQRDSSDDSSDVSASVGVSSDVSSSARVSSDASASADVSSGISDVRGNINEHNDNFNNCRNSKRKRIPPTRFVGGLVPQLHAKYQRMSLFGAIYNKNTHTKKPNTHKKN